MGPLHITTYMGIRDRGKLRILETTWATLVKEFLYALHIRAYWGRNIEEFQKLLIVEWQDAVPARTQKQPEHSAVHRRRHI